MSRLLSSLILAMALILPIGDGLSATAPYEDAFTISAWAGFPPPLKMRNGEYMVLFKGHRTQDDPKVHYALSIRYGYPEFKYIDAKGNWAGILMHGEECLVSREQKIEAKKLPHVRDRQPWHHLAGVYDHGTVSLYLDAKLVMRSEGNARPPENDFPEKTCVGETASGFAQWYFPGEVRNSRYENRAVSNAEIAARYEKELKELTGVVPAYRPLQYPKVPVKGELPRTKAYFDQIAANPPPPRKPNCVAKITKVNDIPRVTIDGKPINGMAMLPSPYVEDDEAAFSCRDFSASGVKLFSQIWFGLTPENKWWLGEGKYDFDYFDRRMMAIVNASPEGWVFPRIKLDPPPWWAKQHPEDLFGHQVRTDSEAWRVLRRRMLVDIVTHVENAPYAAHVIGYHIGALYGGEWTVAPFPLSALPKDPKQRLAFLDAQSRACADAMLDSARLVKELTHGNKLVGAFYGYDHVEHRDFPRVVASPYLDFFCAPDNYNLRRGGESGRSQVSCPASCRLHNKIFWIEADERTLYAETEAGYRCNTLEESIDVAKRTIGYTLTDGWETWWFLLAGNDTFHDDRILETIERGVKIADTTLWRSPPRTEADVAIFRRIQEFDCGPFAPDPNLTTAYGERLHVRDLPAAGVVYDTYVFEDVLAKDLPDYKVYVFPDAKTISAEERTAIDRLVKRKGKTAVWFNAAHEGVTVTPECGRRVDFKRPPKPEILRKTFAEAGAHIWTEDNDFITAGRGFVMLHTASAGVKTIHLPRTSDVTEIYGLSPERKSVSAFTETLKRGETRIYRTRNPQPTAGCAESCR